MPNSLLELEHNILSTTSMVYLLTGALEESDSKEKTEAVAYGLYHLQDLVRKTKDLFDQLLAEIRQVRIEQEALVQLDDDEPEG
jgi:hypothetical protein